MIFKICACAIISCIAILLVKEIGWKGAPLIAISVLLLAISLVLPTLMTVKNYLSSMSDSFQIAEVAKTILKLIGLGYLVGIVTDILKDMGEGLIAKAVLLVGRIEIIAIVIPYFLEVVRIGVSLI